MSTSNTTWYLHCARERGDELEEFLSACAGCKRCISLEDPLELVDKAKRSPAARVALGIGTEIDARNLCGFLTGEAPQTAVLIVAKEVGEDFREQAKRAGASWVLSAEDTIEFVKLHDLADEHEEKTSLQDRSERCSVVSSAPHTSEEDALREASSAAYSASSFYKENTFQEASSAAYLAPHTCEEKVPSEGEHKKQSLDESFSLEESFAHEDESQGSSHQEAGAPVYDEDDLDEPEDFEFDTNVLNLDRFSEFGQSRTPQLQIPSITGESEALTPASQPHADLEMAHPLIAFASARGGVGKSSVASLVALAIASLEKRVALLDLDLNFGNMFGFFGRGRAADLTPLSEGVNAPMLQKCGERINDNLDLFGPCEKPEYADLIVPRIPEICATLSQMYEIVLVDTSAIWGDATASAAQLAQKICLVSDERTGAISSLARGAELLVRLGIPRAKVLRLINRADPKQRDQDFFARKNPGLEQATTLTTFDGGLEVAEFLSAGDAPSLLTLDNVFTSSCKRLSAHLLKEVGSLPESHLAREYLEGAQKHAGTILQFAQRALLKDAS